MPVKITGRIVGVEKVEADFRSAPEMLKERLRVAIRGQSAILQRRVQEAYLAGPRPERLGVVTGRLRRSINTRFTESGDSLTGSVGTNVRYGAAWELGFTRNDARKAHIRALGKPQGGKNRRRQRITYVAKGKGRPGRQQAARPFLTPALADQRAEIIRALMTAVKGEK